MKVTTYKNFNINTGDKLLSDIVKIIKSDVLKSEIENLRLNLKEGLIDKADSIKKALPSFTPSGTFNTSRKASLIQTYSGYLVLDIDKLSLEQLNYTRETAVSDPYTFIAFISPSGNGLKIIVSIDCDVINHKLAVAKVSAYYEQLLNIKIDPSGKDVSRLCFMSYDPNCFCNDNAKVFKIDLPVTLSNRIVLQNEETKIELTVKFKECIQFTENVTSYFVGNRNNFIYQLACNCNRSGIPCEDAENLILGTYDLDKSEIMSSIKGAYRNNVADFAKFAVCKVKKEYVDQKNISEISIEQEDVIEINYLKSTPTIPSYLINNLPDLLKNGAMAFAQDIRKRDVFITSALTIISGCLPNVSGVYHQERVYPHLFSFIIAPPASGKGVLKNAKRLGDKIHQRLVEQSKIAKKQYDGEMADYRSQSGNRKKNDTSVEMPLEPTFKMLFIPADTSQAMMMKILQDSDGKGIICETEADSMSGANKQDWGNYSHIMRAAFHHEKISAARKTNSELLEVDNPQLAISLSGTPAQVPKLIASSEDGLFSRFIFYAFKNEIVWQDPSPKQGGIVFNEHFDILSNDLLQISDYLEKQETNVELSEKQWNKLNQAFEKILTDTVLFNGEDTAGVVFRLGLILFRFCMIFTSLRKYENGDCSINVVCMDEDFNSALELTSMYLNHSILMFNNLSDQSESVIYKMSNNKKYFFDNLPLQFQRKEAIDIGVKFGLSERSVDEFLKSSLSKLLSKPKTGFYEKINK